MSENEIKSIRHYVPNALTDVAVLIVVFSENKEPIAFMGIEGHKLEMLFVNANEIGRGIGTKLIQKAIIWS